MNGDQVTWPKILIFATGADQPPPLGFPEQGKIVFSPQILGTASTCEMTIFLPCQHKNYESFKDLMIESIMGYGGFGQP